MANRLKDHVAIVSGSGQGIGRAIALGLAAEGARVVTNNRTPGTKGGDAETTAKEIVALGGQAVPYFGDVARFADAEQFVKTGVDAFGKVDIVINNAGTDRNHMVWNMTEEEWDTVVDSYLKSSFNCIRFSAQMMRDQKWGRIINTTSTAWLGTTGHCGYGAAKAGIVGLTNAIARELGKFGVTCNAYAPTAGTRFLINEVSLASFKKRFESGLLTKERYEELTHPPGPETCAPFIVYLCTDEACNINSQVFDVTGGNIAIYSEPVRKHTITKDEGLWTVDELIAQVPKGLLKGYTNPAPSEK